MAAAAGRLAVALRGAIVERPAGPIERLFFGPRGSAGAGIRGNIGTFSA